MPVSRWICRSIDCWGKYLFAALGPAAHLSNSCFPLGRKRSLRGGKVWEISPPFIGIVTRVFSELLVGSACERSLFLLFFRREQTPIVLIDSGLHLGGRG